MKHEQTSLTGSKGWRWAAIALQVVLALVFLAAGGSNLSGAEIRVELFESAGLPQWLRVAAGLTEVIGALGLLAGLRVPAVAGPAALLLAVTMIGAVLTELTTFGVGPAVPPLVLMTLSGLVAWIHRKPLRIMVGK